MREHLSILKSLVENFQATGSICPSSSFLASSLAKNISKPRTQSKTSADNGIKILEVGAGTGPVTKIILEEMAGTDRLTICEINKDLLAVLKANLTDTANYQKHIERIEIIEAPVQDLQQENHFDVIVCSLPFLNFPLSLTEEIFQKFNAVAKPGCNISYFSYLGGKEFGILINAERAKTKNFLEQQNYFKLIQREIVWLNLLPAEVHFLEKTS